MHVDVDHAGEDGDVAEVVGHRAGSLVDGADLRSLHFDDTIGQNGATAIEDPCRANRDRLRGAAAATLRVDDARRTDRYQDNCQPFHHDLQPGSNPIRLFPQLPVSW